MRILETYNSKKEFSSPDMNNWKDYSQTSCIILLYIWRRKCTSTTSLNVCISWHFCSRRWGSSLPSLRMLDPLLSPPSTPAENFCLRWFGGRRGQQKLKYFLLNFVAILGDSKHCFFLLQGGRYKYLSEILLCVYLPYLPICSLWI